MINLKHIVPAGALGLAILSGCGGGSIGINLPPAEVVSRVDLMAQSERGMESLAFDDKNNSYLSLSNSNTLPTSVVRTSGAITPGSTWTPVGMGGCAMQKIVEGDLARSARLKQADGKVYLFQPTYYDTEAVLCELTAAAPNFVVNDRALRICSNAYGFPYCEQLKMSDLQAVNGRLYSNAGGAPNLLVSDNKGASWRALLGSLEGRACYDQSFHIIGSRLLVGGECPLDMAYVTSYQLTKDGAALASPTPVPVQVPELENRNIQVITSVPGTQRVFIGVEGGLLRSEDGGQSFKFVIKQDIVSTEGYPYVTRVLSPANKPNVVVAAGFDKKTGKAYLAWSANGGVTWTDLSKLLPGTDQGAQVTSLVEDSQGQLLLTMNEELERKGKLFKLTLGKP